MKNIFFQTKILSKILETKLNKNQMPLKWATPFKIHKPPVEDFWKVYHRGGVNFQMHLSSVWFLD